MKMEPFLTLPSHLQYSPLDFPTPELDDYLNLETMQFVNPLDVNPMMIIKSSPPSSPEDGKEQVNEDYSFQINNDASQPKLIMEEFGDLSALLTNAVSSADLIDSVAESTSIFDPGAIDFISPMPMTTLEQKVKVEKTPSPNQQQIVDNLFTDLSYELNSCQTPLQDKYSISDTGNTNDMYLYQQFAHQHLPNKKIIMDKAPPPTTVDGYTEASFSPTILSLNNNNIKQTNSPQDEERFDDDFSVPNQPPVQQRPTRPKLNLMLDQFKFPLKGKNINTLNTPDVIEGVVQMGSEFNILELINNSDITVLDTDQDFFSSLTENNPDFPSEPSTPSTIITNSSTSEPASPIKKSSRRRKFSKIEDDDDEDYVPPSKKRLSTVHLADIDMEHYVDESSSSSADSYYHSKRKPRGRPPKRTGSISSESSKGHEVTRYRELRDKNNEASRKSRLKRKVKDQEYEKEADELHMKNLRLKTQVEELEKMVNTFRKNLFKVLINK